jgi:hypothetical protein
VAVAIELIRLDRLAWIRELDGRVCGDAGIDARGIAKVRDLTIPGVYLARFYLTGTGRDTT